MKRKILQRFGGGGLILFGLTSLCQAQSTEFSVTYTGGTSVSTPTPGSPITAPYSYSAQTTYYGGGGKSLPAEGVIVPSWTVNSAGPVNAKIKYIGTGTRPKTVILTVYCKAAYFGPSGSANNSLGHSLVQEGTWWVSEGTKYIAVAFPANDDLNYSISPTASAATSTIETCGTRIDVKVTPSPVRINLIGVKNPLNDKRLLIGQQLKATLDFGPEFSPGINPVTYTYTVSAGNPFRNFTATQSETTYVPFIPAASQSPILEIFFAKKEAYATITCSVSIPNMSIAFNTNVNVIPEAPLVIENQADFGEFQYTDANAPNSINPIWFRLFGALITGSGGPWVMGIGEVVSVTTPPQHVYNSNYGSYGWSQTFDTWTVVNEDGAGWSADPPLGHYLDVSHPYPSAGLFPANGPQLIDATHPSFFRDTPGFYVAPLPIYFLSYEASYDCEFHLFVMYTPPPRFPGIPVAEVPLRKRVWTGAGSFSWSLQFGFGPSSDSSDFGDVTSFPSHPFWSQLWSGG